MTAPDLHTLAADLLGRAVNASGGWLPADKRADAAAALLTDLWPHLDHCTHTRNAHDQHHQQAVAGCPWCALTDSTSTNPGGPL